MAFKRVNIDGTDYVPLAAVHLVAAPQAREAAALMAAAIEMARADDAVDRDDGGLARIHRATNELKRAVEAFERRAAE